MKIIDVPKIFVTQDEEEVAAKYLTSLGIDGSQIKIGFHIGATWPAKVWLPDYFAKIAELVIKKYDAQLLVTYGQKDFQCWENFHQQFM